MQEEKLQKKTLVTDQQIIKNHASKLEASQYTSNAITDRWKLLLGSLANMDMAEIMAISFGINELTKVRNTLTRRILLVANHIGFTYPNFVTKIFPKTNPSNIYYKILQLKEAGILHTISGVDLSGEIRANFVAILRSMQNKGNIGPKRMKHKPDFCRVSPAWDTLVKKTIKPNKAEERALRHWERTYMNFKSPKKAK